jgi:hypothetical protein
MENKYQIRINQKKEHGIITKYIDRISILDELEIRDKDNKIIFKTKFFFFINYVIDLTHT